MNKTLCNNCKHYKGLFRCEAFKEKIPDEIFNGFNDHSKPLPKQGNKIVFEKIS